ncbi:IS1 family transposase [Candidatus Poribacteria bacterium]|nr:IS1 family transposase [Candidatus Poribacteria bacterium]
MYCPRCQATQYIKYGLFNNMQRYKCKNCQYQWTRTTPRGHPPEHKKLTVLLYCHGLSMNAISKLFQVSTTAVLKWIRNFAKKQTPKPILTLGTSVTLDLDEMWHYIGNKKNRLWIWKTLGRNIGPLIDWECGN